VAFLADDDVVVHGEPSGCATSMIDFVIWMSAREGVGSPEGWLCITSFGRRRVMDQVFDKPFGVRRQGPRPSYANREVAGSPAVRKRNNADGH